MIIIAVTDIHGTIAGIERISNELAEADLVLLTGDITHFGKRNEVEQIIKAVYRYTRSVFAVPGNCDFRDVFHYLDENKINLHGSPAIYRGYAFIGLGGSLPCPGNTPSEFTEEQIRQMLTCANQPVDRNIPTILVSHQPPYNTINDCVANGKHVGSISVRSFIEEHQPLVCFTGHIHEGIGIDRINDTQIINPGPLREGGYAYCEMDEQGCCLEIRGRKV
jgi:Icc-related predicted phosphoesterase